MLRSGYIEFLPEYITIGSLVQIPKEGIFKLKNKKEHSCLIQKTNGELKNYTFDKLRNYGMLINNKFKEFTIDCIKRMIRENVLYGYEIEYEDVGNFLIYKKVLSRNFNKPIKWDSVFLKDWCIAKYENQLGFINIDYKFTSFDKNDYIYLTETEIENVMSLVVELKPYGRFGVSVYDAQKLDLNNLNGLNYRVDFKEKKIQFI